MISWFDGDGKKVMHGGSLNLYGKLVRIDWIVMEKIYVFAIFGIP